MNQELIIPNRVTYIQKISFCLRALDWIMKAECFIFELFTFVNPRDFILDSINLILSSIFLKPFSEKGFRKTAKYYKGENWSLYFVILLPKASLNLQFFSLKRWYGRFWTELFKRCREIITSDIVPKSLFSNNFMADL